MRVDIDDLELGDVEKAVNYAKWRRMTRLADWRIFAVLMVFVGVLSASFFPTYQEGNSIWKVILLSERLTWNFFHCLIFVILWCVFLAWVISDRGYRSVRISGIVFMCHHVLGALVDSIVVWVALANSNVNAKKSITWKDALSYLIPGTGFKMMFVLGLVLLFMGLSFGAQLELEKLGKKTK